MPRRRRRGASAVAIEPEAESERGLVMRVLLHSPKDMVAGALAFAAVSAIVTNALWLQAGRHPAPLFGTIVNLPAVTSAPANLLPRPRPVEADVQESKSTELKPADLRAAEPRAAEPRTAEHRAVEPKTSDPRTSDPMGNLVKATSTAPITNSIPRPPASIPGDGISGARRVAAVQRALTEYGYGQLKPTGTVGSDTQAAIQKFERARKIPVTGQISDRLVRELTAVIGHPID
nr:peptidoglycan-binding domain-containing protein [Bradyrhizobium sp. dw_411]